VNHRRRQVRQGPGGPRRQGRYAHHIRTHVVSRAPREQRVVAKDDRTVRAAAHGAAHDDHGRLFQSGLHDERCRSAPPAGAAGTPAAVKSMTNERDGDQAPRRRARESDRRATRCSRGYIGPENCGRSTCRMTRMKRTAISCGRGKTPSSWARNPSTASGIPAAARTSTVFDRTRYWTGTAPYRTDPELLRRQASASISRSRPSLERVSQAETRLGLSIFHGKDAVFFSLFGTLFTRSWP